MKRKFQLKEIVARNLRAAREAAGMRQVELAAKTKLTSRYISIAEAGKRNFRLDTLERLAAVLGITVADLVSEDQSPLAPKKEGAKLAIEALQRYYEKL